MDKISKLDQFVNIIAGITFSPAMVDILGSYPVINASAISSNSVLSDFSATQRMKDLPVKSQAVIQNDDVVIASRAMPGSSFKASLVKTCSPLIATSSVYIVRLKTDLLLPEYLNYHLNSKAFQKQIALKAKGATVFHISKSELGETLMPLPTIKEQKIIVKLFQNLLKQKEIVLNQLAIKDEILEATFLNLYQ